MYYICCIYVYLSNIATLSCSRSKRNAAEAEAEADSEGSAVLAGRAGRRPSGAGRWASQGSAPGSPYQGKSA